MDEKIVSDGVKAPVAPPVSGSSVLRSASAMGAATFLSRIMGLVREQVFAVYFGAGNLTDAFNIAFRIPNLLRDLFAEGALSSAFIPTFTRVRKEQGDAQAWRLAGLVFRALFVVVLLISFLGILVAPWLVSLYASAFKNIPGKFELTVDMTRIMFPFFPLVALAAAYMGILNACGRFFMPAFSSALFNVVSVATGLLCASWLPMYGIQPIVGMAVGVVLGGAVQAFSQLPQLYQAGYRWKKREPAQPTWREDPALRKILALMIPGMVGLAATQINVLINSVLATSQGPGAVSWLNYAFRLMQFPIGIFGVSLAAATLPRVSALYVDRDADGIRRTLSQTLGHVFAVNLPASAGLAFLGFPIIQLLFEYGRFTVLDTQATAMALAAYAAGLTAYSAVKVLVPACYAVGQTRAAVTSSVLSVGMTIVLNLALVGPMGYVGLALGTSCAAIFNALYLARILRPYIAARELFARLFVHLGVALAMGAACYASSHALTLWLPDAMLPVGAGKGTIAAFRAFKVFLLVAEGAFICLAIGRIFRIRETSALSELFWEKLKNKLRRRQKLG